MSYTGRMLRESYHSAEKQSVYSTALADRANLTVRKQKKKKKKKDYTYTKLKCLK